MKSDEKLWNIFLELLDELYKNATPPLKFKKFYEDVESEKIKCPKEWFMKHKISEEDTEKIEIKIRKKYKLTQREWDKMAMSRLNYYPACI
jgi:hypothetical protein